MKKFVAQYDKANLVMQLKRKKCLSKNDGVSIVEINY